MTKFLTQDQIERVLIALKIMQKALKPLMSGEPPIALVGGLAMQAYGSPRMTRDVDIIAPFEPPPELLQEVGGKSEKLLSFGGRRTRIQSVKVDWIVRNDEVEDLYDEALSKANPNTDFGIPVVTPEYLAVIKLWAGRKKDILDLKFLLLREKMNDKILESITRRHLGAFAARELVLLKKEAAWERSQGILDTPEEDEDYDS